MSSHSNTSPHLAEPAMTVPQVARLMSVSKNTIYAAIKDNKLQAMRFGTKSGTIRIRPEDLRAYEQSCLITNSQDLSSTESKASSGTLYKSQVASMTRARLNT